MNKQEILNEIDKLVNTIAGIPFSTFMGYSHGETTAFTICRGLVEQLDEPQKVKVPEFVAEWIEYAKKKGDSLYDSFKPWDLYGAEYVDADRWIANNGEEYARAWLDGYEVKEEPKWVVKVGNLYFCGWEDTTAQFVMNAMLGEEESIIKYKNEGTASSVAKNLGGTVEKVR